MNTGKNKLFEFPGGGGSVPTAFSLIAIDAGVATLPITKKHKNFYLDAGAAFTVALSNPKEGETYVLNVTKTIAGDVLVTLPAGESSPATINLIGAVNSMFELVISYDKFSDGAGGTVLNYVVTSFAL